MTEMSDSKEAVMRLYAAYASGDAARIAECLTEDVAWIAPAGNATAVALGADAAASTLDRDAIVAFMANDFRALFVADVSNQFRLMIAEGEHVVAEARLSATLVNGRAYANDYCFIYRVRDGRVAEIREYMDTRGGWAQVFGDTPGRALV